MKLIIGLGNPGFRYRNTRHNAGFIIVTKFAKSHGIRIARRFYDGLMGEGRIGAGKVLLFLPQTFMNLSGTAVSQAAKRVENLSDMLVVYDDIDLKIGSLRFRPKGSSGGHKGLKSIIEHIGDESIPRLRVGIRPDREVKDTAGFVLTGFSKPERPIFEDAAQRAVLGISAWIKDGMESCMTRFNGV